MIRFARNQICIWLLVPTRLSPQGACRMKALWGGQHRRLLFTIRNHVEVTGKNGLLIKIGQLLMTV